MKMLWIAPTLAFALAGCNGTSTAMSPTAVANRCNTVVRDEKTDPGLACYRAESSLLTVEDFGDSISLGWSAHARHDLCGVMDLRHDNWTKEDINMCGESWHPYQIGEWVANGSNNGYSTTALRAIEREFADSGSHRNVVTFNIGYHDMQRVGDGPVNVPLDVYRNNLEAIAQVLEQHADIVIWIDSTPLPGAVGYDGNSYVLAEDIPHYNSILHDIAAEHNFYMMSWNGDPQHYPHLNGDVHFTDAGYAVLAKQVTNCILSALQQQVTEACHK